MRVGGAEQSAPEVVLSGDRCLGAASPRVELVG